MVSSDSGTEVHTSPLHCPLQSSHKWSVKGSGAQTVIRTIGTKLGLKADSYTEAVQVSIGPSNKTNNPRNTTLPFLNAQHFTVRNPIGVMPKAVVIRQPSLLPFSK